MALLLPLAVPASAARAATMPQPFVSVTVLPTQVVLDRPGATQQLVVMGRRADGSVVDLTPRSRFVCLDPRIASVSPGGSLASLANGPSRIRVTAPDAPPVLVRAIVRNAAGVYRWDYARQIAPVLARAGCSGASCHGASAGRGGLKLSLFGQDPEQDYEALVRAGGGRRVDRVRPGASLLLLKPSATLAHGGGVRFTVGSAAYRLLARWIAAGAPRGGDPARVERLEMAPPERLLTHTGETQRLLVTAYLSDGTREDVSELAQFESKNEGAVTVDGSRVTFAGLGDGVVLARYAGLTAAAQFTATNLPVLALFPAFRSTDVVDGPIYARLRRLRVPPAPDAPDPELVRRLYLDLIGRIPTPAEVERYCRAREPGKREALIAALLDGPEFPKHWRDNLNALLMGRAAFPIDPAWAAWLETSLREDRGWDRIARDLLLARPETSQENAALQFMVRRFGQGDTGLDTVTRDVSRIFFGVDIQCARCHTHPDVAAWQQQAYWGLAAFFGRSYPIQVKGAGYLAERARGEVQYFGPDKNMRPALPVFLTGEAAAEPASGPPAAPPPAGGMAPAEPPELFTVPPEEAKEKTRVPVPRYSRRQRLVEIAVNGRDPYFKRAVVNWVWAQLMGRGLVEPVDQMHSGNPASHPLLLQTLSDDFAASGFSLRKLIRTIVGSQAYARGSTWKPVKGLVEKPRPELFAVAAVRPQSMSQLAGSMMVAAGYLPGMADGPSPEAAGRARTQFETQLAPQFAEIRKNLDGGTDVFQPNVAQALYLANSPAFQQLLDKGGLSSRLANLPDDEEVVRRAYVAVLSRPPEAEELAAFRKYLTTRKERRAAAVSQIVWALITSAEFRFIH